MDAHAVWLLTDTSDMLMHGHDLKLCPETRQWRPQSQPVDVRPVRYSEVTKKKKTHQYIYMQDPYSKGDTSKVVSLHPQQLFKNCLAVRSRSCRQHQNRFKALQSVRESAFYSQRYCLNWTQANRGSAKAFQLQIPYMIIACTSIIGTYNTFWGCHRMPDIVITNSID